LKTAARGSTTSFVLIDGDRLADLMLRFGVGATTRETFAVQEIDEDFFTEELGEPRRSCGPR